MKSNNKTKLSPLLSAVETKINQFYILAFAPILLVFFYSPFSAVIPFYGFLLFFLKHPKLSEPKKVSSVQKILGAIVLAGSFFVYYVVVVVYPETAFYGPANYAAYLLGLFLIFFGYSALREAFAPLFLIVAATSSTFISAWLKPIISPFSNDIAHIIVNILRTLRVNTSLQYAGDTPVIILTSISGRLVAGAFTYECIGVYSALVFSIILVVILFEDPSRLKVRIAFSVAGLGSIFALNILRVTIIFLTDYFYGAEAGGTIHYILGYALFSTWLACFFYIYFKRQTILTKITSLWGKIR